MSSSPPVPRRPIDPSSLTFAPEDLDSLFLNHPSPAILYDRATGDILAANHAAELLYGWTREELARMHLADIRPPAMRETMEQKLRQLSSGVATRFQTIHQRRDGQPIDVEVYTQPMRLDGRPVTRAVMIDITARLRAEALFRGVAEQALTGIYVIQDERFVYLNPRLAEMFGYTVDEILARTDPYDFLPPETRDEIRRQSARRLAGSDEAVQYTLRARRRDGRPLTVEVHGSMLTLHGRPALLGTVLDVTERALADQALAESERRFRAAFDQSRIGMTLTAPDGRWLRVNDALASMLGYTREELAGRSFQEFTHRDDLPQNLALLHRLLAGEIAGYDMEKRFVRRDGGVIWVSLHVSLVRDEHDAPVYTVAQMQDVTARRRAEESLHEREAQLRHAQKMEAAGRLAGGVAHDFNNLLTVIGSNADLGVSLAEEGSSALSELTEIRAAVDRAAALTRQLLAFSRRQVLAPLPVPLNDVVRDAERMLGRVIGDDVVLETFLDDRVGEVVADRGQLEQLLMNLVVNARDAMPDGGLVTIVTSRGADGMLALSVTDSGVGMTDEVRAHAFEPFFTTKPQGKGTGLGLSTVYGIAQQSGGSVRLRSAPEQGTTVTVMLPESGPSPAAESAPAPATVAPEPTASGEGRMILVVDDESGVRDVARKSLARFGFRVLEARNGSDALFIWSVNRARIALVLTDAVMPLMGGRELADRLRELGCTAPIVFMSGYSEGVLPDGAELIEKPFTPDALSARIREVLDRAAQ